MVISVWIDVWLSIIPVTHHKRGVISVSRCLFHGKMRAGILNCRVRRGDPFLLRCFLLDSAAIIFCLPESMVMKQPVKRTGGKAAPKTKFPKNGVKRKTREELDKEARERKRQKKHRGHTAGSRSQAAETTKTAGQRANRDPRIGSKKPVPLGGEHEDTTVQSLPPAQVESVAARLAPEEELALLENDERLDALLERLDNGETLSAEDQQWVDKTLDRINDLMDILGIELGDDEEEEEPQEDMLQLLKRNNPKDAL